MINLTSRRSAFTGSVAIARKMHLNLLPQWQMEFQVTPGDFFFTTIKAATGSDLPLALILLESLFRIGQQLRKSHAVVRTAHNL